MDNLIFYGINIHTFGIFCSMISLKRKKQGDDMKKILIFLFFLFAITYLSAVPGIIQGQNYNFTDPLGLIHHDNYNNDNNLREPIEFDSSWVSFEGNWPFGYCYSLSACEEENLIFVGSGAGVKVTDVSEPGNPVVLSEIRARSLVDASYYDASIHRLYLAAYFSGVEIWDLSDVNNPVFMSRCPTEPYPRAGIYASGDYVFAATVSNGLRVLDVSDPFVPHEVASCFIANTVWGMSVSGDYAYLNDNYFGM